MSAKPINKLFKIIGGKPAPKGENAFCEKGTPFVKMKDLGRAHFSNDLIDIEQKVSDEIAKANGLNIIKRGSILLPRSGSVALNHRAVLGVDAYMVSHICALEVTDEKEVNNLYAYYYLRSIKMDRISKKTTGLDAITFEDLGKIKIPLPPLDDQKHIAHLLGKVEGLIARRKQHLQQLDDLLKSVFLEMFGDPVRNEKGWEENLFSNLFSSSPRIGTTKPVAPGGTTPVVRVGELGEFQVNFKNCKMVALENDALEKCRVEEGDILLARAIASQSHLGKASLITNLEQDTAFDSHVMRIRFKEQLVNPVFAYHWLKSDGGRNRFLNAGGQTSVQFNINSKQISSIKMPLPPIGLQNQFATIVEKVEGLKSRYQQSLADLQSLYGALSQKAFKGELDLSRMVLPVELTAEDTESTEANRQPKSLTQGFARQLLAAEILHRHNGHNMTQMKLQKLIHLAEHHAELNEIQGEYQRQAAGPYDNKMMYGIASSLKKQRWFETNGRGQNATYSPLASAGCHEKYLAHWRGKMVKVDEVLGLLGHASPAQCEIASTLYAAWNDLLIDGEQITDERIIEQASKAELWHMTKEAIDPARWPKALQWMRDHDLVPTGYGKHTRKLK